MVKKAKKSLYEVLGVSHDANDKTIKRAWRKASMRTHPDQNKNDPHANDKFKTIMDAFEVLKDAAKRAAYDRNPYKVEVIVDATEPPKQAAPEQDNKPTERADKNHAQNQGTQSQSSNQTQWTPTPPPNAAGHKERAGAYATSSKSAFDTSKRAYVYTRSGEKVDLDDAHPKPTIERWA